MKYTLLVTDVIILAGFMGAGKTTVGRLLAERLGWEFRDLDDLICEREGRSVPEIFRDSGEEYFRRVESACLKEVLDRETKGASTSAGKTSPPPLAMTSHKGLVLALGGGAFVQKRNADFISGAGVPVVFLDAAPEALYRRCEPQRGTRPLLADANQFRQLYESRRAGYMTAGVRVDTTALSPAEVAEQIASRLDLGAYS